MITIELMDITKEETIRNLIFKADEILQYNDAKGPNDRIYNKNDENMDLE